MQEPLEEQQQPANEGATPGGDAADTPSPLPDNLDVEELLSMGAAPAAAADDAALPDDDDNEADDLDDEDDADADGDADNAGTAGAQTPTPQDTTEAVVKAGEQIANNPDDVTGVLRALPKVQRGKAIGEALRLAYVRGTHDMFQRTEAVARQESELREFYDKHAQERTADPEAFTLWEDENPEEAARFAEARRYFKAKADGKPVALPGTPAKPAAADGKVPLTEAQQVLQNLANREAARLQALPKDAQEAILAKGFALTEDGLTEFRAAITAAENASRTKAAPAAAQRRQEAHRDRLGTARVDTGTRGNAGTPKKNPIADINDPDALLDMAIVSGQRRRARV